MVNSMQGIATLESINACEVDLRIVRGPETRRSLRTTPAGGNITPSGGLIDLQTLSPEKHRTRIKCNRAFYIVHSISNYKS